MGFLFIEHMVTYGDMEVYYYKTKMGTCQPENFPFYLIYYNFICRRANLTGPVQFLDARGDRLVDPSFSNTGLTIMGLKK